MRVQDAEYTFCNHHLLRDIHHPRMRILAYAPCLPLVAPDAHRPTADCNTTRGHHRVVEDIAGTPYDPTSGGRSYVRACLRAPHV